jgi:hypothetical protein
MAFQSAKLLCRRRAFPTAVGFAMLCGVGLMNSPKARMDGPPQKEDEERRRQDELEVVQRRKSTEAAKEFCSFADKSPS